MRKTVLSVRTIGIIFRKELLDILRDRKTLVFMVALPILLMPALMSGMTRLMISQRLKTQSRRLHVAMPVEDRLRWIEFLATRVKEREGETAAVLSILAPDATSRVERLLADLKLGFADALAAVHLDEKVRGHAGVDELKDLVAASYREAQKRLAETTGSKPGANGLGSPPQGAAARRLLDLLVALLSIDYLTPPEMAARKGTLAPALEADLPADVRAAPERLAAARAITSRAIEGWLTVPDDLDSEIVVVDDTYPIEMTYDSTVPLSDEAHRRIAAALDAAGRDVLSARLARPQLRLPESFTTPLRLDDHNVATEQKQALRVVAGFLPYIILLMCFLGGLYPAIDLGAAEKERLTLETLLVSPASRLEIATGKFGVVFLASLLAALLATVSMGFTFESGLASPELRAVIDFNLSPLAAVICLALIVPTAAIFAAILLALSIRAKTFKEAQASMMPLQFAVIVPAVISLVPDIELNTKLALVPVLNVALGLRHVLTASGAEPPWLELALIFVSTAAVAGGALWFCARRFGQESVLFRS